MKRRLLDESAEAEDGELTLTVNKEYAQKYQDRKKKEEISNGTISAFAEILMMLTTQ